MNEKKLFTRNIFIPLNSVYDRFPELMDEPGAENREFNLDLEKRLSDKEMNVHHSNLRPRLLTPANEFAGVRVIAQNERGVRVGVQDCNEMICLLVIADDGSEQLADAFAQVLFDEIAKDYAQVSTRYGLWSNHYYAGNVTDC